MENLVDFIMSFLNSQDFSVSFYSNIVSDFIISIVFGIVITRYVSNKINQLEQREQKIAGEIERTNKAIELVIILKNYSQELHPHIEKWIVDFAKSAEQGEPYRPIKIGSIPRFDISFWYIYRDGGEISKLLSPSLIMQLCKFFENLSDARRSLDWAYQSWEIITVKSPSKVSNGFLSHTMFFDERVVDIEKLKLYSALVSESLIIANSSYEEMGKAIDSELSKLEQELSNLNNHGKNGTKM